jgi:nitrite reductase (NO-forming)
MRTIGIAVLAGLLLFAVSRYQGSAASRTGPAGIAPGASAVMASPTKLLPDDESGPTAPASLASLAPKASLPVIRGIKTVAPDVPPPTARSTSAIVEYGLDVVETKAQLAPDLTYKSLWAFDGVVPGPVMRVRVGDVIRVRLGNSLGNVTGHNIDFHFINGACGGCANTQVKPGESKTIEVRALYPGLFMYHCAYGEAGNIIAVHIANGMYGYLIVDPAEPLPPVARELMVVEGEFYVDEVGAQSFENLVAEKPTHVFFNGKHAALQPPLTIRTNERVRMYFGKGGVNGAASFHIIGAVFDRVYADGGLTDPPREHGIQTVEVPVGGATIVEFVPPVPGKLTVVDHNLSRVCFKGLGLPITVEGPPNPELYEAK